jgi:hypothetical protein
MKIKWILLGGIFIFLAVLTLHPQQEVVISIKEGMPAIPLALPDFIVRSSLVETKAIAQELHEIISKDLKYSRVFQLLPKSYYSYIRPLMWGRFRRAREKNFSSRARFTTSRPDASFLGSGINQKKT